MTTFAVLNDWVTANLKPVKKPEEITKAQLDQLIAMADAEDPLIKGFIEETVINTTGTDTTTTLAALKSKIYNPTRPRLENANGGVIVKRDIHSTDGIFIIVLSIPHWYVMRIILRVNKDFVVLSMTTTLHSFYESTDVHAFVKHATYGGKTMDDIYSWKEKIEKGERLDPEYKPDSGKPFKIEVPPTTGG